LDEIDQQQHSLQQEGLQQRGHQDAGSRDYFIPVAVGVSLAAYLATAAIAWWEYNF
jgi:hypothetical protein